ncbi:MAG: UPF0175 family protein [Nitrospirota bacterium]
MSSTIAIEIPREIIHATRMTPEELRRELAIYLFQQGKLSFGKAREMAGYDRLDLPTIAGKQRYPYPVWP